MVKYFVLSFQNAIFEIKIAYSIFLGVPRQTRSESFPEVVTILSRSGVTMRVNAGNGLSFTSKGSCSYMYLKSEQYS